MDQSHYPPAVRALLRDDHLPELGPGRPNTAARAALDALTIDTVFGGKAVGRADLAQGCLAGLWLVHDFLDESHSISQDISSAEGSYWHGIMHRREPDAGNAAYWFRRVGKHPVFTPLCRRAAELTVAAGSPAGSEFLARQGAWDAFAFIDLCEAARGDRVPCEQLCRQIQRAEWDLLFAFCYVQALAS
jgi:hypothetical protein